MLTPTNIKPMLAQVFSMIILIVIWYFVGSMGGLWVSIKIYPKIRNRDLVFLFTICGIGGLLTFFIGLTYLPKEKWCDKEVFKKIV